MGSLLVLLCAAAVAEPALPLVLEVDPGVLSAARALGPSAAFFTSAARPLQDLAQIRESAAQVGTGDVAGAKEIQALLRAGGVKVSGGAVDLMRLYSANHLSSLFRANPDLRLFVIRARDDGRAREIVDRGGGVRLVLRSRGETAGATASKPPGATTAPTHGGFITSFGPLVGAELSATARSRQFDAQEGVRKDSRPARKGHVFVVLHLHRDFSTGVGLVSFLFGSGIIVKPNFAQLRIVDSAQRPYPLSATYAEGRTVDLAYEVPADARGLMLRDGDTTLPLTPLLSTKQAAAN